MSTTPMSTNAAVVYAVLLDLEGGSHTAFGLRDEAYVSLPADDATVQMELADVDDALDELEAAGLVVSQPSPGGTLWSLR